MVALIAVEAVPAGQRVQLAWPVASWYLPPGQLMQLDAPAKEKVPSAQLEQLVALPPSEYLPLAHDMQENFAVDFTR